MTYKFMNGWLVKIKDIDKIKKAIQVDRATALEKLYVYGWIVKAKIANDLNYKEAVKKLRSMYGDKFIEESYGLVIMKAGAKYLVFDISMLCEADEISFGTDGLHSLYDLLEGKF